MTEIAPGMMVECIRNTNKTGYFKLSGKYIVNEVLSPADCEVCPGNHIGLNFIGIPSVKSGYAFCCFRPIGGDKEIEREESKRTGKSAKGDMRNGDDHPEGIKFFIIDMDDRE